MTTTRDLLLRRAVDALTALRTLSEVPARNYAADQSSHTAESTILVTFTSSGDMAPVEPSEFLFHRDRINAATDELALELAVLGAEEGLRAARKRVFVVGDQRAEPGETRAQVVQWHQAGLSVAEIAYKGDLPVKWVQYVIRSGERTNVRHTP